MPHLLDEYRCVSALALLYHISYMRQCVGAFRIAAIVMADNNAVDIRHISCLGTMLHLYSSL